MPETHKDFWQKKFSSNKKRDDLVQKELKKMGWRVLIVWECKTQKPDVLNKFIIKHLEG